MCHSDHEDDEAVVVDLAHHAVVADAEAVLAGPCHQALHPVRAGLPASLVTVSTIFFWAVRSSFSSCLRVLRAHWTCRSCQAKLCDELDGGQRWLSVGFASSARAER